MYEPYGNAPPMHRRSFSFSSPNGAFEPQSRRMAPSPSNDHDSYRGSVYSLDEARGMSSPSPLPLNASMKDIEIQSLRRELNRSDSQYNLSNIAPPSPSTNHANERLRQDLIIKEEYERMLNEKNIYIHKCEQQIKELKAEISERNAQVALDIITASKKSVEVNETIRHKDMQISNLQRELVEKNNQIQVEKVENQKAIEVARSLFSAELKAELSTLQDVNLKLEMELKLLKTKIGAPSSLENILSPSGRDNMRLSNAETQLGKDLQLLKQRYGIPDTIPTNDYNIDEDGDVKKLFCPSQEDTTVSSVSSGHTEREKDDDETGSPNEPKNEIEDKENDSNVNNTTAPASSKPAVKTAADVMKLFGISNTKIFDGEMMKKKYSSDFLAKESYVWINPATRSIHWAKAPEDKKNLSQTKYLLLKKSTVKPEQREKLGEMKGMVQGVKKLPGNGGIVISTDTGDSLELKIPPESVQNWAKVLRVLV